MNTCKLLPQKSSPLICEAKDILEVNASKEYTLICSNLLQRVLTDNALNAGAVKLWQILFNKSKFDKNLEVRISYNRLAEIMNKSIRTIYRHIGTLKDCGYLLIQSNYSPNKSQEVNTFMVRFPKSIIDETKKQKDRQTPLPEKVIREVIENTSSVSQTYAEEHTKENKQTAHGDTLCKNDKNVRGGADKDDIQYNTISEDININNNNRSSIAVNEPTKTFVVDNAKNSEKEEVVLDELKQTIAEQKLVLHQCRENRDRINKQWANAMQSGYDATIMKKIQSSYALADTKYIQEKTKLDMLLQQFEKHQGKEEKLITIATNKTYMLEKSGERIVSISIFKRLIRALEMLGYDEKKQSILANEIIFSVRFGNLIKSTKDNKPLPVGFAVSIATKLVREGRWTTPVMFGKAVC